MTKHILLYGATDDISPSDAIAYLRRSTGPWHVTVMGTDGMTVKAVREDLIRAIQYERDHSFSFTCRISVKDGVNYIDFTLRG